MCIDAVATRWRRVRRVSRGAEAGHLWRRVVEAESLSIVLRVGRCASIPKWSVVVKEASTGRPSTEDTNRPSGFSKSLAIIPH
jgi:hypothetical protein